MPESSRDTSLARSVGQRLRLARLRQRKQQTVVAGLAGITTDYLYQIERGLKVPSLPVLLELARVLDLSVAALVAEPFSGSNSRTATLTADEAAAGSRRSKNVHRRGGVPIGDELYAAMTAPITPSETQPAAVATLRESVAAAWQAWQQSPQRYSQVSDLVPCLVIEIEGQLQRPADAATARRATAGHASDLYGLLRSFCKRVGQIELSLLSAERAIRTAQLADDPVRLAAAQWNLAHVLLADGHVEGAEDVAIAAAEAAHAALDKSQAPDQAAVYGSLLLVAAMAAARRGDAWSARSRVADARRLAEQTGELNTCWTVFGPTNVAMHAASVELLTGHATDGLQIAEGIDHRAAPSIERRIAFLLDQAEGWRQRRDNAQVLLLLLEAEREAPEDMRYRPASRRLVQHLVKHSRRSVAEQAAHLATRLGVPV